MKSKCYSVLRTTVLSVIAILLTAAAMKTHAQGAAPSEHLVFNFPSDAVLKMHKIKITQTAYASYFEINSFAGGYAGLQHTPDSSKGSSHIMISSLWDPNTAGGVYSRVDYSAPNTYTGRFGGEGDGYQSINPYNWTLNTWYNQVIRSWKANGRLNIATFIQDLSSGEWFHTVTMSVVDKPGYLNSYNDAFLENWTSSGADRDGRFVRKAFFKDCWNLNAAGAWEKHTSRYFSANANDQARNGIYDRAFNSGYDSNEDAYFMQHGGNTTPDPAFGTGRTLTLPPQAGQGSSPTLTTGALTAVNAIYSDNQVVVSWEVNTQKSPQLSATVEVLNEAQQVVATFTDTLPERRADTLELQLPPGDYTASVRIRDIFSQLSEPLSSSFTAAAAITTDGYYRIKNVASGKYLAIEDSATDNLKNIVQYTGSNSDAFQWQVQQQGSAYSLINKKSGKAIDLANSIQSMGTKPIQYVPTGGLNQQWNLIAVGTDTYLIQSNMSNHYVLDNPASSSAEGTHIIIYAANGITGSANQRWILEPVNLALAVRPTPQHITESPITDQRLKIWPNPTSGDIYIQPGKAGGEKRPLELIIYNSQGIVVKRLQLDNTSGGPVQVATKDLAAGIYYLTTGKERTSFIKK